MDRDFAPVAPKRLWVADFTYVPTWTGMVYGAFVVDAFARRIIGWRAAWSMTIALVLEVLRRPLESAQHTSVACTTRLIDAGVDPSVGSVGDALDNALAETTVGSFKNELIWREGPWRDVDHVEIETLNWVDWFNTERPHDYLDDLTPARAEQLHYIHTSTPAPAG